MVAHLHRDRTELEAARVDAEAARLNGEEAEAERGGEAEDEDEGGGLYIGAEAAANGAEAGGGGALCGVRRRLLRPPPPTVLDEGDGAYTVGYGSCVAGRLLLHLSLGTRPLCPPIGLRVLPAEACAQHSLALPTALGQRGGDDAVWAVGRWATARGNDAVWARGADGEHHHHKYRENQLPEPTLSLVLATPLNYFKSLSGRITPPIDTTLS